MRDDGNKIGRRKVDPFGFGNSFGGSLEAVTGNDTARGGGGLGGEAEDETREDIAGTATGQSRGATGNHYFGDSAIRQEGTGNGVGFAFGENGAGEVMWTEF